MEDEQLTYLSAGVDIDAGISAVEKMKESLIRSHTPSVLSTTGSFAGLFRPEFSDYADPCLVSSIDGVGTKISLASATGRYHGVGKDLVNHCVNDILVTGAKPLFFLDYFAAGKLDPIAAAQVVEGAAEACLENGCALIGGETAEMPGVYTDGECDFAGCVVGIVDREKIPDPSTVKPGDAIIGLASTGLHTNGFSLARAALFDRAGYDLESYIPELGQTLADALLAVHRSYLGSVQMALKHDLQIRVMAHITGGGLYENLPRVLPEDARAAIDRRSWTPPPIFDFIQTTGNIADVEMYRTFNMGIGLALVVSRGQAPAACEFFNAHGEVAWQIGEIAKGVREVQIL